MTDEEGWLAELLPPDGRLFINGDTVGVETIARRCRAAVVRIGSGEGNDWRVRDVHVDACGSIFSLAAPDAQFSGDYRVNLLGRHQVTNAALAIAVGAQLGLAAEEIRRGLAACEPPKMRLEVSESNGVSILNDAYNANADSMLAALQTLHDFPCAGRRIAVLGDMAELGAHGAAAHLEVGRRTAELGGMHLLTVGRMAVLTAQAAREAGLRDVTECRDVAEAVAALKKPGPEGRRDFAQGFARDRTGTHEREPGLMLYYLSQYILNAAHGTQWQDPLSGLRVFQYITVRSAGAAVTALLLSWWWGPKIIAWLQAPQVRPGLCGQGRGGRIPHHARPEQAGHTDDGWHSHRRSPWTCRPLLWAQWNTLVQLTLLSVLVFAGLGFYDDYAKITKQNNLGAAARIKLWVQGALGRLHRVLSLEGMPATSGTWSPTIDGAILQAPHHLSSAVFGIPRGRTASSPCCAIVGSSNAVNLTDGLDGLAIGCTIDRLASCFSSLTYLASNVVSCRSYLAIPHVVGAGRTHGVLRRDDRRGARLPLVQLPSRAKCSWATPARSRWAGRSASSPCLIHQPFLLVIAGGVFVIEAASVMIQTELVQIHPPPFRHRPESFPDGSVAPPLREEGLVRVPGGHAVLHPVHSVLGGRGEHFEDQVKGSRWRGRNRSR